MKRREIFKDTGIYALSSYIAQGLDMINGVLFRRFLGPHAMGMWAFLQVVQNYAKHTSLGVTTATARDIPYYREKKDVAKAEEVQNLVFTFTMLTSALTALGIVAYAWVNRQNFQPTMLVGLLAIAIMLICQRLYNLYVVLLRAHKQFVFVGVLNVLTSALSVVLTLLLTWRWKFYGFLAAMVLNYVFAIVLIRLKTQHHFRFYLSWKALLPMVELGVAICVADLLKTALMSIDRILITKMLGFEALGFYSIALMADNYLYSLPNMLAVILFPHFQEAFAKRDSSHDLQKYLMEPTLSLAIFFPLVIGFVWIFSGVLVGFFLPQYVLGLTSLRWICLGAFFFALTHAFYTYWLTIKKHWMLIPMNAIALGAGVLLIWTLLHNGGVLTHVACARAVIAAIYFVLLSGPCLLGLYGLPRTLKLYGGIFLVFGYFSSCLGGLDLVFSSEKASLAQAGLKYVLFLILMLPVIGVGEKRTGVIKQLVQLIKTKKKSVS